jgi:hypothetical protein
MNTAKPAIAQAANNPNIIGNDHLKLKQPSRGLAETISRTMKTENSKTIALSL